MQKKKKKYILCQLKYNQSIKYIFSVIRSRNFNSDSEDDIGGAISRHFPDFALSLCGGLKEKEAGITPHMFNEKLLDHKEFVAR